MTFSERIQFRDPLTRNGRDLSLILDLVNFTGTLDHVLLGGIKSRELIKLLVKILTYFELRSRVVISDLGWNEIEKFLLLVLILFFNLNDFEVDRVLTKKISN